MESLEATLPYLVRYSYLGVYGLILLFSTVMPFFSKTLVIVAAGILASQGLGSLPVYLDGFARRTRDSGQHLLLAGLFLRGKGIGMEDLFGTAKPSRDSARRKRVSEGMMGSPSSLRVSFLFSGAPSSSLPA